MAPARLGEAVPARTSRKIGSSSAAISAATRSTSAGRTRITTTTQLSSAATRLPGWTRTRPRTTGALLASSATRSSPVRECAPRDQIG